MANVKFGWSMPRGPRDKDQRASFLDDTERAFALIKGHFESVWLIDHLQFDDADLLEALTTISYYAALHPEFKFGNAVICQSFRNPALLAKIGATLQYLSGGRFILGIGAGWHEPEYTAYGYDFPPPAARVEQLDETLQIIKALWREEQATFHGKHYRVEAAYCEPKPDPVPTIMVGAFKPRMLRVAARHADWWNVSWTGIDEYRKLVTGFEQACAAEGRATTSIPRSWFGGCSCAPTEEQAIAQINGSFTSSTGFVGSPQQLVAQMRPFVELGVEYFMLGCGGFPTLTTLEMLVNEVLPELNS